MKNVLKEYFKQDKFILVDRAFLGLYASLLNIKKKTKKRKVIFPSITCPSPVFASIFAGFKPIFTDINMNDFLMEYKELECIVKNHNDIAAIVYIYTFGHISDDIFKIKHLIKDKNIYLIEDVAQGFGGEINGCKAGLIGDLSIFSFGYSKQIDVGNGGILFINSKRFCMNEINDEIQNIERYNTDTSLGLKYKEEFYTLREKALNDNSIYKFYSSFPSKYKKLYFKKINVNWNLAKDKLVYFINNKVRFKRNEIAKKYSIKLLNSPYKDKFTLPNITNFYSTYRYTFLVENRKIASALSNYLRINGINCSNLYIPVSRFFNDEGFNNAINFAERVINLWVDDIADDNYIDATIRLITNFYRHRSGD